VADCTGLESVLTAFRLAERKPRNVEKPHKVQVFELPPALSILAA
jgi:hypothetical protein